MPEEKASKPPLPPKSLSVKNVLASEKPKAIVPSEPTVKPEEKKGSITEPEADVEVDAELVTDTEPASLLDNALLHDALTYFLDTYLTDKPIYSGLISGATFSVEDDNTVKASFDSQVQIDMFIDIKTELIVYLRDRFSNSQLDIVETAAIGQVGGADPSRPKLYTDEDKLKYMAQKNPLLLKFKQQFNLDFK
jgi:hypothetical protein